MKSKYVFMLINAGDKDIYEIPSLMKLAQLGRSASR